DKAGCGTSGRPEGKNKGPSEMLKPLIYLVGAIGFEPTTSCSQIWLASLYNIMIERRKTLFNLSKTKPLNRV
ncbi:MAG: hypothetical protein PHX24_14785, partial [Acidithiobacillus sp.]|nr:hypothetical protein [Acidithiobacillus sp.]